MHEMAPVTGAGNDELELKQENSGVRSFAAARATQERITMKWASMWRSIILSGLDRTLFPYSHFIRILKLQDLRDLLIDEKFRVARVANTLFDADLAKYRVDRTVTVSNKKNPYVVIDPDATVNRFAEVITQHAPLLEELRGCDLLGAENLSASIPLLPHLQTLSFFAGEALVGLGPLLSRHCPHFNTLSIYGWNREDADRNLAAFLNEIRPNCLRSFEVHSRSSIGAETFLALNCHRESLQELKMNDIKADAIRHLSLLKECTNIQTLLLAETTPAMTVLDENDEHFLEMVAWLRECTVLQTLTFNNFLSAPSLLKYIAIEHQIKLSKLEVENYSMAESKEFHLALAHQPSLKSLSLRGEASENSADTLALVDALSKLGNLTELRLRDISDYFLNEHIICLAHSLKNLEHFWTSGYGITDEVWPALSTLMNLRHLEFNALTRFTTGKILDFIACLGRGNKGLALLVMMQENDCDIPEEDQLLIQDTIKRDLDGRFTYMLWKGQSSLPECWLWRPLFRHAVAWEERSLTLPIPTDPDAESYSVESD